MEEEQKEEEGEEVEKPGYKREMTTMMRMRVMMVLFLDLLSAFAMPERVNL